LLIGSRKNTLLAVCTQLFLCLHTCLGNTNGVVVFAITNVCSKPCHNTLATNSYGDEFDGTFACVVAGCTCRSSICALFTGERVGAAHALWCA
jgi:hypothetical protein